MKSCRRRVKSSNSQEGILESNVKKRDSDHVTVATTERKAV